AAANLRKTCVHRLNSGGSCGKSGQHDCEAFYTNKTNQKAFYCNCTSPFRTRYCDCAIAA
uniref:S-locus protein 11 n=1 Tax=Brassica campestris TaxID=3711 RepID=UPI000BBB67E0|nr:Chain G, S-locus protein 11 [Brassica rapa]5GYY_H Chain H, S-locus protein 11 [Brassica rapa]